MEIQYAKTAVKAINGMERRFVPDDVATPDDLRAIRAAREEYAQGETVPHSAINWNEKEPRGESYKGGTAHE